MGAIRTQRDRHSEPTHQRRRRVQLGPLSFEDPGFIGRFLSRNDVLDGGQDAASTLAQYRIENRTVEVQELNLSPAQLLRCSASSRSSAGTEQVLPYDYFLDNCRRASATRWTASWAARSAPRPIPCRLERVIAGTRNA